jgi:cytochrome c-type biogenesis protein CcmH
MYYLYGIFILMLIISAGFIAIPFLKYKNLSGFLFTTLFVIIFSLSIYQFSNHTNALRQWLTTGKQHYQLQVEINKLGGIDGIIKRIKDKLAINPQDPQGWLILGKLYIDKQDYDAAKKSLEKAHQLDPDNQTINHYYEIATGAQ